VEELLDGLGEPGMTSNDYYKIIRTCNDRLQKKRIGLRSKGKFISLNKLKRVSKALI